MTRQTRNLIRRPTSRHSFRDVASHGGILSNSLALPSFPGHWSHNEDIVMDKRQYREIFCGFGFPKMRLFPPMKKNLPSVSIANSLLLPPQHTPLQPCVCWSPSLCTLHLSIKIIKKKQYRESTDSTFRITCLSNEINQCPSTVGLEIGDDGKRGSDGYLVWH